MRCPKCNSENTQIQAKEFKPKITVPAILMFGGFGLAFLGIIGLAIGIILGLILSAVFKSVFPTSYESVLVCQSCGCAIKLNSVQNIKSHPLFCPPDESNLIVLRKDEVKGTIVNLRVWVDGEPFDMHNGVREYLKISEGVHIIKYEQTNGLDKKHRNGEIQVNIENDRLITFSFTRSGIKVDRSR